MTGKRLSFEQILSASDMDTKDVFVSEWGGDVTVKGMTKRDQQQLRKLAGDPATGQVDADRMEALMLAHCLADPAITIEQAEMLLQKSASAVDKVLTAIMDVAGLSDAAQKAMVHTFHGRDEGSEKES